MEAEEKIIRFIFQDFDSKSYLLVSCTRMSGVGHVALNRVDVVWI